MVLNVGRCFLYIYVHFLFSYSNGNGIVCKAPERIKGAGDVSHFLRIGFLYIQVYDLIFSLVSQVFFLAIMQLHSLMAAVKAGHYWLCELAGNIEYSILDEM